MCRFISTHLQILDWHLWQLRVIKSLLDENPPRFYCAAALLAHFVGFSVPMHAFVMGYRLIKTAGHRRGSRSLKLKSVEVIPLWLTTFCPEVDFKIEALRLIHFEILG